MNDQVKDRKGNERKCEASPQRETETKLRKHMVRPESRLMTEEVKNVTDGAKS